MIEEEYNFYLDIVNSNNVYETIKKYKKLIDDELCITDKICIGCNNSCHQSCKNKIKMKEQLKLLEKIITLEND